MTSPAARERAAESAAPDAQEERQRVGEAVVAPTCKGCGKTPPDWVPLHGKDQKPKTWFSRTRNGVTEYACSRACIPSNETILPW